jgi:hypothetical protein
MSFFTTPRTFHIKSVGDVVVELTVVAEMEDMDNALLTAENHVDAYWLLGDDGEGSNSQARCELAREIMRYHPEVSKADRQTVIDRVIAQWIEDANS